MKKLFVRLMCCFVPSRKLRHKIRKNAFKAEDTLAKLSAQIQSLQQENKEIINLKLQNERLFSEINSLKIDINEKNSNIMNMLSEFTNQTKDNIFNTRHDIELFINRNTEKKLSTALLHQKTFPRFKGIHAGKDIVILATGPSLNDFKPIKNAIYIGVNSAFKYDKVKLDYLFAQDYSGMHDYIYDMDNYKGNDCVKFYGLTTEFDGEWPRVMPESHAVRANALRYRTDWELLHGPFECKFAYDLSTMPLGCFGSIVFPAVQFALWTNPKRIYLVGCDCSNAGHFDKTANNDMSFLLYPWKKLKEFISVYYPDTEIISVNPVGLRGIFKDMDQNG